MGGRWGSDGTAGKGREDGEKEGSSSYSAVPCTVPLFTWYKKRGKEDPSWDGGGRNGSGLNKEDK